MWLKPKILKLYLVSWPKPTAIEGIENQNLIYYYKDGKI
jgi:hypothetical protein